MDVEEKFISIATLICEPTRAKMLWQLLDDRAYTAGELAIAAEISSTAASNHLSKLLDAEIIKVEIQGRHRYYSLSNGEVAYVVEALANLAHVKSTTKQTSAIITGGVKYCRTCYDHLAGYVGVKLAEASEDKGYLKRSGRIYLVTKKGWDWLSVFGITQSTIENNRRPLTRQCLDWSERKPHLAGQLGSLLLEKMLERKWFRKVQFSRELQITPKGRQGMSEMLGLNL